MEVILGTTLCRWTLASITSSNLFMLLLAFNRRPFARYSFWCLVFHLCSFLDTVSQCTCDSRTRELSDTVQPGNELCSAI